jgi:hypothetical protein
MNLILEVLCDRNYYFRFSLFDQLKILLEIFKLDYNFNSGDHNSGHLKNKTVSVIDKRIKEFPFNSSKENLRLFNQNFQFFFIYILSFSKI